MNELVIKTAKSIFSFLYYLLDNFVEFPEKSGNSGTFPEKSGNSGTFPEKSGKIEKL
jgi:hypothetical protein